MKDIYIFKFWKHKYGTELLIDIVDYAVMLPAIRKHPTFTETFYSVTIVLDADETVSVDGVPSRYADKFKSLAAVSDSRTCP